MRTALRSKSHRVISVALLTDAALTLTKFAAASLSGSTAMFSEALHSLADTASQGLFLLGQTLSRQPPDANHPFGYGKERFFWPFMVSVVIFSTGGVVSLMQGIGQIRSPRPLSHFSWNFVVLGTALIFDGLSWIVARRELTRAASAKPIWKVIRESKTPSVFAIFLQDSSALVGIVLAGAGMVLARWTGWMIFDGIASLAIGILLFVVALIIAAETKSLLIGEGASNEVVDHIRKVVADTPEVEQLTNLLTMQLGPEEVLVNLDLEFRQGLQTHEIERIVDRIEKQIRYLVPDATKIFIEVESAPGTVATRNI